MQEVGTIYALFVSQEGLSKPITKADILLKKQGILEDKHYGSIPERTVLIASLESYKIVKNKTGIEMTHGYLGENILIDYNPYHLLSGTQLHIGTVVLEISKNCTLCNHLAALDKRIPKLLKKDRGIFAKVVEEGSIKIGDKVYLKDC
ncbi:MAG: MOSC domain-containing protein [Sulfurovum sp.]|nr:MOSC domain-containing protein [Sulfurovum sp.]